jgi:hypothetical protein
MEAGGGRAEGGAVCVCGEMGAAGERHGVPVG